MRLIGKRFISKNLGGPKDGIFPSFQKMDTRTKRVRRRRTDLFKPNPASGEFRASHLTRNMPILEIGFGSV
jgi:hypothetical protein